MSAPEWLKIIVGALIDVIGAEALHGVVDEQTQIRAGRDGADAAEAAITGEKP